MFECKYKFSEEDNVVGTVETMKRQPQKAIKFLRIFLPILLVLNVALLVWDIMDGTDIYFDIVMIVVLILSGVMIYCMPSIYKWSAKKAYEKNLADKDLISIYMDENTATVSFFKGNTEVAKEVLNWTELTDYAEDENRLVLIFNLKFIVIRKDSFNGELDLFKMLLNSKTSNKNIEKK